MTKSVLVYFYVDSCLSVVLSNRLFVKSLSTSSHSEDGCGLDLEPLPEIELAAGQTVCVKWTTKRSASYIDVFVLSLHDRKIDADTALKAVHPELKKCIENEDDVQGFLEKQLINTATQTSAPIEKDEGRKKMPCDNSKNSTKVTSKKRLKKSKVTQSKGSESLYDKVSDEMAFQILSMRRGIPAPTPVTAQHISTRHYTLAPTQTSPQHHEHTATRQDTSPPTTTQKHSDKRPYTPAPTQPDTPAPTQHTATNLHMAAPTQTVPKYPAARPQHHERTATRQDTPPPTVTTPQYPTTRPTTMWTTSTPAYTPPAQTPQHHERTATRQDTPPPTVTTPQYPTTRPTTMMTSTPAYTPPAQTPQYPFIPTYENQPQHTSFDEPTNWYHGYGQTYSALLDHVDSPEPITHQGMQCQCGEVLARVQALEFEVNHLREQAQSGQSAMSLPKNKKFNGLTLEEIKDHVNGMNVTAAVKYLMNHLFKPEELVTKTIRGQATHNQKGVKKESLPENIVSMIIDIVKSQHKSVTLAEITTKIRNRIKMMRQQAIFD